METTSVRVNRATRDRLMGLADHFGVRTADAILARLLDEHWEREAVAAVEHTFDQEPGARDAYLAQVDRDDRASAPTDRWNV